MKTTRQVQYLNNHLNDNDEKVIKWLNAYLHTAYTYIKRNMDGTWLHLQPGFPDKYVKFYYVFSNPYDYGFGHKTNRIKLSFTDNTETDISLYAFKKFIRNYESITIY